MLPMKESGKAAAIVNPAAGKGAAARRWSAIEAELTRRLGSFEVHFTEAPGHGTALARAALANGVRRIIAVGGDGTVNARRILEITQCAARVVGGAGRDGTQHGVG
jgi:diacylglycerol kinase family enzyme